MTAVPSAVRGLTALCEMEEVNTRLTSTNLIDSSVTLVYTRFTMALVFFPTERDPDIQLSTTIPSTHFTKADPKHASGAISTARLYVSLHLHLPPINVVVSNTPLYRNTHLQASFALRCFQRLSDPHVATQPYHRHDN